LGTKERVKLQPMQCATIKVKPFGETPLEQASAHFALQAEFALKHDY